MTVNSYCPEMEDYCVGWFWSVWAAALAGGVWEARSEVRGEVEPLSLSSPLYVMESVSLYVTFSSGLSFAQRWSYLFYKNTNEWRNKSSQMLSSQTGSGSLTAMGHWGVSMKKTFLQLLNCDDHQAMIRPPSINLLDKSTQSSLLSPEATLQRWRNDDHCKNLRFQPATVGETWRQDCPL